MEYPRIMARDGAWRSPCLSLLETGSRSADDEASTDANGSFSLEGDAIILSFIGIRQHSHRQRVGGQLLDVLVAEARRRGLARFVGENRR